MNEVRTKEKLSGPEMVSGPVFKPMVPVGAPISVESLE
jgi:hypothetical protein